MKIQDQLTLDIAELYKSMQDTISEESKEEWHVYRKKRKEGGGMNFHYEHLSSHGNRKEAGKVAEKHRAKLPTHEFGNKGDHTIVISNVLK